MVNLAEIFVPDCPRMKQGCSGVMRLISGQKKDAWKCDQCGTEVWTGDMPTYMALHEMLHTRTEELMSLSMGAIKKGGGSKSRRRKKQKRLIRNYVFDVKPRIKKQ